MKRRLLALILKLSKITSLPPTWIMMFLVWLQFGLFWFLTTKNQINPEFSMTHLYMIIGETVIVGLMIFFLAPKWMKTKPSEWPKDKKE